MKRFFLIAAVSFLSCFACFAQEKSEEAFRFAVSGDSRNCGDVVMPAIAASARAHVASFYWHLGDFRMMGSEQWGGYKAVVDEDMCQEFNHAACGDKPGPNDLSPAKYREIAWEDFVKQQVAPFEPLPVFLGIGNHEMYKEVDQAKSHQEFAAYFSKWLHRPEIEKQRLHDFPYPEDAAYYDWKKPPVDFVYLDNSSEEGFDKTQLQWLTKVLERDKSDPEVRAIVVGMHRALPNSLACGHSMNGDAPPDGASPEQTKAREDLNAISFNSGLQAYKALERWQKETNKFVYILASHSHFFMENIFDTTYWNDSQNGTVLSGWLVGTAGARRYVLPPELEKRPDVFAATYVYGYLLASVKKSGEIHFEFRELTERDVPEATRTSFGKDFVNFCFYANRDTSLHCPPSNCSESAQSKLCATK